MPWIKTEDCIGCGICLNRCPITGAIEMENGKALIHQELCTKCGVCLDVCPKNAVRSNRENPALKGGRTSGGGFGTGRGSGRGLGRGSGRGRGI